MSLLAFSCASYLNTTVGLFDDPSGDGLVDLRKDTTLWTVSNNIFRDHDKTFGIGEFPFPLLLFHCAHINQAGPKTSSPRAPSTTTGSTAPASATPRPTTSSTPTSTTTTSAASPATATTPAAAPMPASRTSTLSTRRSLLRPTRALHSPPRASLLRATRASRRLTRARRSSRLTSTSIRLTQRRMCLALSRAVLVLRLISALESGEKRDGHWYLRVIYEPCILL